MKILYISPENTVGTLNLWKQAHEARGNECKFITFYPSRHNYDPGICLNLPLIKSKSWYTKTRHHYYQLKWGTQGEYHEKEGHPPVWKPNSVLEQKYFQFRDWLWSKWVEPAIQKYNLKEYDIFHLEWGLEFYRDGRFVKQLSKLGKPIICTYHGQDLRTRGVIPVIDKVSRLNLTSELDLMKKHPSMNYLFLPFDTSQHQPKFKINDPIRICHSPTDRYYKGSDTIIPVCENLAKNGKIEFILIENVPHNKTQQLKQSCDILIDQVHNRGGWGYGMNSIEALSMGLCCLTEVIPKYEKFIPDHPFININGANLYSVLIKLFNNPGLLKKYKKRGRDWVIQNHDLKYTTNQLYGYYNEKGWIKS